MSQTDPYATPQSSLLVEESLAATEPVGFWLRAAATLVDTLIMLIIVTPLAFMIYGGQYFVTDDFLLGIWDGVLNYVFPAVATILFWHFKGATPGKMLVGARIVDADTGGKASGVQLVRRYFGYIPSALVLFLGFFWVLWDANKQGWHDKLANTKVVKYLPGAD